jgi:hypothetical protein
MNECFMNPHEQAILESFLEQLVRVRGTRKIPEADAMIRRAVDRQPDAADLEPLRGAGTAGFLGQAAATAAGVAGGEFLFQGLENLLSPHSASAANHEAQSFIPQDVTVNNYYGSSERPNGADDDRPDGTGDPDPAEDEFVSDDDDDTDFI